MTRSRVATLALVVEPILSELQRVLTADEPLDALASLTALRAHLDAFEREQVRRARRQGVSYGAIGRGLGLSRQAAHRRYQGLTDAPRPVLADDLRPLLAAARSEAARAGASEVTCEHLLLALAAAGKLGVRRVDLEAARVLIAGPLGSGPLPARVSRDLRALLTEPPAPRSVEALIEALRGAPSCQRLFSRLARATPERG
jgi:hypothetical protein